MNSSKPLALVTNDDGIDSNFLHVLCREVSQYFEIIVCAPDGERSWIGHAISRHQKLKAVSKEGFPGQAYALNGTPADCVNFAIGNLCSKEPDAVISGINLGYNVTLPMILSSGTVGAAMEGSLLGIPSFACSMSLPENNFEEIRVNKGLVKGKDYHQLVYKPEWLDEQDPEIGSDLWVLEQGKPSVSRLSFADISGRKHLEP